MAQVHGCAYSVTLEFGQSNLMSDLSMAMEPVTFSESGGVRYLHFGSELIQGAMRIRDPDEIYLEYNQQMMAWLLFLETKPGMRIAQLGLGTGVIAQL
jgi:spermidine synthase